MPERMPITPSVLKWARERAGYTVDDLSKHFKLYSDWEVGNSFPTYSQLESLSDKFKCPMAVFFFPEPPEIEPLEKSFRTLPDIEFEYMPRSVRMLLRKAKAMQLNLMELNDNDNPSEKYIIRNIHLDLNRPISELTYEVRSYLSVTLNDQISWSGVDEAFEKWRNVITDHGVYVFKDAFKDSGFSGFCLYHAEFPIIYINNTNSKSRQIFTLIHELTHLLLHTSGIDKIRDDYIYNLQKDAKRIEIFCNEFTAAFLVPDSDFLESIQDLEIDERSIYKLAQRYNVSREVILRKFLSKDAITKEYYEQKSDEWAKQAKGRGGDGGDYYFTQIAYLGPHYINLVLKNYHQNKIDVVQLGEYLNIKPKYVSKFEDKFNSISKFERDI
ncbi:MAG: ImmA/IrrE family metallo-endopeptidase [Deltaproteobacteria bacterium]